MSSTIIHTWDIHELSSALLLLYEVSKCEQLEISHFFSPLLLCLCADHPSQLKNPVAWHSNYRTGKILIVGNQRTPRKKESYRPAAISNEHSWREEKISAVHALQILSFLSRRSSSLIGFSGWMSNGDSEESRNCAINKFNCVHSHQLLCATHRQLPKPVSALSSPTVVCCHKFNNDDDFQPSRLTLIVITGDDDRLEQQLRRA